MHRDINFTMKYREVIQFEPFSGPALDELAGRSLREIIRGQLARRTPEQQALVEAHLAKFPGVTGGLLAECAELFPFHPEVIGLLEKIPFISKPALARILSAAVGKILDEPVPADRPGWIAADDLWLLIRADAGLSAVPEIEAVVYCSGELEKKIARKLTPGEPQKLALRLVRALSVHRLASGDIYSHSGATAAELCGLLCLLPPDVESSEKLLVEVTAVFGWIHRLGAPQFIFSNPENDRHFLHIIKVKRFIKPELILHWVNALPFLLLMLTGVAMLASRFWHFDRRVYVVVHEVFAAGWLIGLPLTVLVHARIHWEHHLRLVLSWRLDDLLWMTQSFRSLYNRKITPPPAGRFNAGQKINATLVFLYFLGFSATGLLMFFKGSILFPWYVHTALFFSAMGSAGGHMYLSLINPGTRVALAGIFHGWAPINYVEHHHPLSLPPALQAHAHAPSKKTLLEELSISKAEVIILIVTILLAGVGLFTFKKAQLATIKKEFAQKFADSINPSALSLRHRRIGPLAESCTKCHSYTGQIPDDKCEVCHVDIKERRVKLIGYHGTFKGDCRTCHQEHPSSTNSIIPFVREKFDHKLAGFKLDGKHAKLQCDECHKKLHPAFVPDAPITNGLYYIGLKSALCINCHKDIHEGQFKASCEKCHTASGWQGKDLKFAHDTDSTFKLEAKHKTVDCAKCHKPIAPEKALGKAKFKGLGLECVSCHEDPHRKQFVQKCDACHSAAGWKKDTLLFKHDRDSKFPLLAKHNIACEKCHTPSVPGERLALSQMHGLKTGCVDCHKDPHRGQFKVDCTQCHPATDSWKGKQLRFDHSRDSKFVLIGKHLTVDCLKCHLPQPTNGPLSSAQFKELKAGCEACHQVKHPAEYGPTCLSCHTLDKQWTKKKPAADHSSKNEVNEELLLGKHITTRCESCHKPELIPALGHLKNNRYDCSTCHFGKEDPHKGTLGSACYKCHSTEGWKGEFLRFNHDTMTSYGLNQDHKKVACMKCHENNHWKPVKSGCLDCHPKLNQKKIGGKIQLELNK